MYGHLHLKLQLENCTFWVSFSTFLLRCLHNNSCCSSPKRRKSKSSKRKRSPSISETSSDEEERRRKKKEEKKRARKAKEKEEDERRRSRRRRHRSPSRRRHTSADESEDNRNNLRQPTATATATAIKHQSRERSRSKSVREASSRSPSRNSDRIMDHQQDDDLGDTAAAILPLLSDNQHSDDDDDDDDDDMGPQPMQKMGGKKIDERSYGGALLRGEGSAMAAFLQDGIESRIPRRGEIGLTSDQIAQYEDVGYVMSGSRHRRMNAVRMRKENQVISAEEKRGILKLQRDERERREAILREEFSELVNERLKGSTSASEPRPK
jgi:NF-kappa-B-activating protein C-terminal domain